MKYIIKNNKEEKPEPEIELWLEDGVNGIALKGKNKTGRDKYLMNFRNGKFSRIMGAYLEGLETDIGGRIIEE